MAVVLGTNSGFVTVAPTTDPAGTNYSFDTNNQVNVTKHTSPAGATKITEIGWWCDNNTEESNFEVGLYAADGAVVPNEAGTLLYAERTNAKGTTNGWKTVTVDWDILGSTDYWLAVQLDDTATETRTNYNVAGGMGEDRISGGSGGATLNDPCGGGSLHDADGCLAIYALYTSITEESTTNIYQMII